MSNVLIPNAQLMIGAFIVLENAQSLLDQSKLLYEEKKYQGSIALATISLEESLKGFQLVWEFRRKNDLSRDEWSKLKTHKHKLSHVRENAIEIIEKASNEEEIETRKELQEEGTPIPNINKEEIIKIIKDLITFLFTRKLPIGGTSI